MDRATLLVSFTMPDRRRRGILSDGKPGEPKSRPEQDTLIRLEISLIARFNSLLDRKKFPVWSRRELLGNALIPLSYLERLADVGVLNERNSL